LSHIRIDSDEAGKAGWAERAIPENPQAYPEARMFGRLPAAGLFARHVRGLRAHDLEFKLAPNEERPAVHLEDVRDVELRGLRSTAIAGTQPVVKVIQSKEVSVRSCTAPPETKVYLEARGDQCEHILLVNNDLTYAQRAERQAADVPFGAILVNGNIRKPPTK